MPYLKKATDAAFGLAPYTAPLRVSSYVKGSTTNIFAGDIVTLLATGLAVSMTDNGLGPVIGVSAETTLSASAGTEVMVYDHPEQLFVCQEDSVGTALAQSHFGTTFKVTGLTPGTAAQVTRGRSITQMDTSTTGTGISVLQFIKMHEIEGTTFPTAAGDPRKVVVKFLPVFHYYATESGAI